MKTEIVRVSRELPLEANRVWAVLSRFCVPWHPWIEWMREEKGEGGAVVRCFKVKGESALYREQLTNFSESDRIIRYQHLEGIAGASSYNAECQVRSYGQGCIVDWVAAIVALPARSKEIAEGTRDVFNAGLDAVDASLVREDVVIAGEPALTVAHSAPKPGPLLLFLHGIGGNRRNWEEQLDYMAFLAECAALDLRGYGGSKLGPRQTRIDDHCSDILRVMDQFGKQQVILCGLSLGAWIATSFAMRHPEKLAGLALAGGCTGMSETSAEERQAFLASREKPLSEGKSPADFSADVVKVIAGPNASAAVQQQLLQSMSAIPSGTYRDAVHCFTHPEEKFDFGRIACPVLLMTGEHDRLASPAEIAAVAKRMKEVLPPSDVRFEVIAGAGHICNLEQPQRFNELLANLVGRAAT